MAREIHSPSKSRHTSSHLNILTAVNPEIFETSPRPGGFLKVMVPTRSQDYVVADHGSCPCHSSEPSSMAPKSKRSVGSSSGLKDTSSHASASGYALRSKTSRDFRLKTAVRETDWEDPQVDEADHAGVGGAVDATMNMLAVTISCVMMMAVDEKVPADYLTWALAYLQCIRDDDGATPVNIEGLISEITKRLDSNYQSGKKKDTSSTNIKKSGSNAKKSDSKLEGKKSAGKVKSSKSLEKTSKSKSKTDKSNKSVTKTPTPSGIIPTENVSTLSAEKPS